MGQFFKKGKTPFILLLLFLILASFSSNKVVVLFQYDKGVFEFDKERGALTTKFFEEKFKEGEVDYVAIRIFNNEKKYLGSERITTSLKLTEMNKKYLKLAQNDSRDKLDVASFKIIREKVGDNYRFYYLFSSSNSSFYVGNTKCLSSKGGWSYVGIDNPRIEISIDDKIVYDKVVVCK